MKHTCLMILCFWALMAAACTNLEESGWMMPRPQESDSMRVVGAGFESGKIQGRNMEQITYFVVLRLFNPQADKNKYVVFEFQNPENRSDFEKVVIKASTAGKNGDIKAQSQPIFGLKPYTGYLVKISLASDAEGTLIDETLNQYVRSYFPPSGFTNKKP